MNVLMMSNTYFPIMGGLEKSIASFSRELRKRGHKVMIVAPEIDGSGKKEYGVVRVPAIKHVNGTDFAVNLPVPALVSKVMEAFKPDIVHAHHPFLMGDMAMRLAGQYRIPLVFTYHIMFEQYNDFLLNSEAGKNFVVELAAGYSNLADHVIAPSDSVKKVLRKRGVKTPVAVIPTGVMVKKFKQGKGERFRRKQSIPPGAFLAAYTGRMSPEKNLEFLARAAAVFLKRNPKAYFAAVGRGPSLSAMRKIFTDAGVKDRIRFAGILRGGDLLDAYHAMDVFAFASKSETQGMVLTEAMAAGVPVVGLDASGVREVVRDRKNGRLVLREEELVFARALEWMARLSATKRKKIKCEALRTAEDFSLDRCAVKLQEIYLKARAQKERGDNSPWHRLMGRIKTEFDMLANVGRAAAAAVVETAKEAVESGQAPKEKEVSA